MALNDNVYAYMNIRIGYTKNEIVNKNIKMYNQYLDMIKFFNTGFFIPIDENEVMSKEELINSNMTFNPNHTLQCDIMTSTRKNMRYKLNCIIEQANFADTIIVIPSLNVFGDSESIKSYYKIFRKKQIGILYIDYTRDSGLSEYSTYGFGFCKRGYEEYQNDKVIYKNSKIEKRKLSSEYDRVFDLVNNLTDDDLKDNRGRIGRDYSKSFRVALWLYELFKIPEDIAVQMSGFSKNGFHMKADNYEQTQNYKEELKIMEEHYSISTLVKRNRPVPKNFDKIIHWYEKKNNLELACIHCKVPMIFPIDYKRLLLKTEGGRKELARCLKLYDQELINNYSEWIDKKKEPTEFYKKCGDIEKKLFSSAQIP